MEVDSLEENRIDEYMNERLEVQEQHFLWDPRGRKAHITPSGQDGV